MLEPVCLTAPLGGSGERSNLQSNICSTFLFFMLKILFGIPTQFGVSSEWQSVMAKKIAKFCSLIGAVMFASFGGANANQVSKEALEFVILGDTQNQFVKEVNFTGCTSEIVIDSILFGWITVRNDWDEAIWNSKEYVINDQGKWELRLACRDVCSTFSGDEGVTGLLSLGAVLSGIDLSRTISLEISASTARVDKALDDIRRQCPGVKSKY